jgi:three-Cys-motif partner protein
MSDEIARSTKENDDWGGPWTETKIEIFIKYLRAYLEIMKKQRFKLIYFDGFAGSGKIAPGSRFNSLIESVALRVLEIKDPKSFDMYYLVELNEKKKERLKSIIIERFPDQKEVFVVAEDCNDKLVGLSNFLRKNKSYRSLAFVDPHGMEVNWSSLEAFTDLGCDLWILVPTGIGVNRMLTKDGLIQDSWIKKLEKFLGISEEDLRKRFYREQKSLTLFGEENYTIKEEKALQKIIDLYSERLLQIWKHVSKPYPMKNSTGSIMFHFLLASQSPAGKKIADDIIGKIN